MTSRQAAQRRVDRIRAFREELAQLEREQILSLSAEDGARLAAHHDAMVAKLAGQFDVDVASEQHQLSLGMRLASAFGALALGASVFLFFYHFWPDLTTPAQVVILVTAPFVGLVAMAVAARLERTRYVTSVLGVMTVACFVLDLSAQGQIFNLVPTPQAFLAWGAFAVTLAYAFRVRWLLVIGLGGLTLWVSASLVAWTGVGGLWSAFDRSETLLLPAAGILLVGSRLDDEEFAPAWRLSGWFVVCLALLVLSLGGQSLLPLGRDARQLLYQVGGMAVTAGLVTLAVKRQWNETVNLGAVFFTTFLLTHLFDWWWVWLPGYLFFLIVGLIAVGLLLVFRRLRRGTETRA